MSVTVTPNRGLKQPSSFTINPIYMLNAEDSCSKEFCNLNHKINFKSIKHIRKFMKDEVHRQASCRTKLQDFIASFKNTDTAIDKYTLLEKKLLGQKLYLNMVVHDLRSPTESIHEGLEFLKKKCTNILEEIVDETIRGIEERLL